MNVMKAVMCTKYGAPDVLEVGKITKPVPGDSQVLIKVYASSVTTADSMMRQGTPKYARLFLGLRRPKNPVTGTGFSGKIEAVGKAVTLFKVDDLVFGETALGFGANAEYVCVPENGIIIPKPGNLTFNELAPVCDGPLTSLNFLKDLAKIKPGQKVLINGASGSLGTAAVQIAKILGATVTGVCSTANLDMVKSLGADEVIDYTVEDFTKSGQTYDVIYDTIGKSSFSRCKKSLAPEGQYISPVLSLGLMMRMIGTSIFGSKKAKFSATGIRPVPELKILLEEIKGYLEQGRLKMVMDQHFTMDEITAAHRYVDTGRKRGNIVLVPIDKP